MNNKYNWNLIVTDYENGLSKKDLRKKYNIKIWAWSNAIKTGIIKLRAEDKPKRDLDEILVMNSPAKDTTSLKNRLLKEDLLKNICTSCGLGDVWNKKRLVLHLDHINGNNKDNRLENLRMLCPNCHSQTNTYCGNKRGSNPSFKGP